MQLGKSLLGGIIGAVVAIGLLMATYLLFGVDHVSLAIPFAIITGLGVRMLATTSGHASYVRGALTMVLALAAYIGGWLLVARIATARAKMNAHKSPPAVAQPAENKDAAEAKETEPKEAAPMPEVPAPTTRGEMGKMRPAVTQQFSTWNFIWLAIAAFIAYELGRGSEVARVSTSPPAETAPADTPQDTGT